MIPASTDWTGTPVETPDVPDNLNRSCWVAPWTISQSPGRALSDKIDSEPTALFTGHLKGRLPVNLPRSRYPYWNVLSSPLGLRICYTGDVLEFLRRQRIVQLQQIILTKVRADNAQQFSRKRFKFRHTHKDQHRTTKAPDDTTAAPGNQRNELTASAEHMYISQRALESEGNRALRRNLKRQKVAGALPVDPILDTDYVAVIKSTCPFPLPPKNAGMYEQSSAVVYPTISEEVCPDHHHSAGVLAMSTIFIAGVLSSICST
mmetsp:Transcript_12556/g.51007  ORF Transcript_12556/g.51007 Transcript_12556/m.51007 type:complete len:262 (-) Transcript_12556:52-837(-)